MRLAEIQIDRNEAKLALGRYPRSMDSYARVCREIVKGNRVINLVESIKQAGLSDEGLPRFAVSSTLVCRYDRDGKEHRFYFLDDDWSAGWLTVIGLKKRLKQIHSWISTCPPVPSAISEMKKSDDLFCWEAAWSRESNTEGVRSLEGPVLLRPVGGNLYSVIAEWDLTELERKIFGKIQL